jgi:hypothetical protein
MDLDDAGKHFRFLIRDRAGPQLSGVDGERSLSPDLHGE